MIKRTPAGEVSSIPSEMVTIELRKAIREMASACSDAELDIQDYERRYKTVRGSIKTIKRVRKNLIRAVGSIEHRLSNATDAALLVSDEERDGKE